MSMRQEGSSLRGSKKLSIQLNKILMPWLKEIKINAKKSMGEHNA